MVREGCSPKLKSCSEESVGKKTAGRGVYGIQGGFF